MLHNSGEILLVSKVAAAFLSHTIGYIALGMDAVLLLVQRCSLLADPTTLSLLAGRPLPPTASCHTNTSVLRSTAACVDQTALAQPRPATTTSPPATSASMPLNTITSIISSSGNTETETSTGIKILFVC